MKDKIEQIRGLLDQLENDSGDTGALQFSKNYNALELPSIVTAVVEFLHPILTPYEIAIYWYLFNNSIVKTGEQYVRASTRGLSSIAKSGSGQAEGLGYAAVQKNLNSLKDKGVIFITGDTNRGGTLYKVLIPDEIPGCKVLIEKHFAPDVEQINSRKELDFYNVLENRHKVFERDGYKCHYCGKQLTRFSATLDHIQPVSKSGDNSFENLVTSCLHCNAERGNKPVMDFVTKDGVNNF
jgi:hypothetical protein